MHVVDHNPPQYQVGTTVRVSVRYPIGHYRVPYYMRGKEVRITRLLGRYVNPEEEAFGRNAGSKIWSYKISIPQKELWPDYQGAATDTLHIEIFEPWLEPMN
jgi:nitrile hydratase